jgi:para-nitrobenzyl esterase
MKLPLTTLLRVAVAAGVLVASALPLVAGGDSEDGGLNELTGTTWYWQRTLLNDDTSFAPDDPSRYTLTFQDDGTVSARVDCNRMGGTYKRDGASITIELTHGTRAMCPPDSLDIEFQRELSEVRQMVFAGGAPHFDLAGHRGTMTFIH